MSATEECKPSGTADKLSQDRGLMPPPPPRLFNPTAAQSEAFQTRIPTPALGSGRTLAPSALRFPPARTNLGGSESCTTSAIATENFDFTKHVQGQSFVIPSKMIAKESDVQTFLKSSACQDYMSFIKCLCGKLVGVKVSDVGEISDTLKHLLEVLSELSSYVDKVPPQDHTLRYGNPAYRDWHKLMCENAQSLVESILPDNLNSAAEELAYYFKESFGNKTRIDYGTGHETNFIIFLYCIAKLGVIKEEDSIALVLSVFSAYLKLMRKIQTTYWLEPAGSRGCWGLDDYQLLPFLFGSAQLINHGLIKPKSIHNMDFIEMFSNDFMYFSSVQFVLSVKKGPIKETSPMLTDISVLGRWQKVNNGLIKMYEGEVLSKFPIMQHLGFGSLFKWN